MDTNGYVPANVGAVARALTSVAGRYVFLSTVSVYQGWPVAPVTESALTCRHVPTSYSSQPGDHPD